MRNPWGINFLSISMDMYLELYGLLASPSLRNETEMCMKKQRVCQKVRNGVPK